MLGAWLPILQQYGPALIQQCENAEGLAREWLETYMFAADDDPGRKAEEASVFFADHRRHQSHSLGVDRDQAREVGVKIEDFEADPQLQDAVLTVHHAAFHALGGAAVKVIENHLGSGFFKVQQLQVQGVPIQPPVMVPPAGGQPGTPQMPPPGP